MHCFMCLVSQCDIRIYVVSQCRILMAVQLMSTELFVFF